MRGPDPITTVGIAGGLAVASQVSQGKFKPGSGVRIVLAGVMVGAALSFMSNFAPEVAAAFSWLLIVGSLLINGTPVFNRLQGK